MPVALQYAIFLPLLAGWLALCWLASLIRPGERLDESGEELCGSEWAKDMERIDDGDMAAEALELEPETAATK